MSVGKCVFGEAGLRAINEFTMSYCNFVSIKVLLSTEATDWSVAGVVNTHHQSFGLLGSGFPLLYCSPKKSPAITVF